MSILTRLDLSHLRYDFHCCQEQQWDGVSVSTIPPEYLTKV